MLRQTFKRRQPKFKKRLPQSVDTNRKETSPVAKLPAEIGIIITSYLSYDNLIVLKLTNKQFYGYAKVVIDQRMLMARKRISAPNFDRTSELLQCIYCNDVFTLLALKKSQDIDCIVIHNLYNIYQAIRFQRQTQISRRLILTWYNCTSNGEGKTMLHFAATFGDNLIVMELVEKFKVPVDITDQYGHTPLFDAVDNDCFNTIYLLVKKFGADVNVQEVGMIGKRPLHRAVENRFWFATVSLFDCGADVNVTTKDGDTPLHWAAKNGYDELIVILIDHGATINAQNKGRSTPLHLAVKSSMERIIRKLINEGVDINARDLTGCTPLHLAIEYDDDIAYLLIESNANVHAQCIQGFTPLHIAIKEHSSVIGSLLYNGADVNVPNVWQQTSLHLAMQTSNYDIWNLVALQKNADFTCEDSCGHSPLFYAQQQIERLDASKVETFKSILKKALRKYPHVNSTDVSL